MSSGPDSKEFNPFRFFQTEAQRKKKTQTYGKKVRHRLKLAMNGSRRSREWLEEQRINWRECVVDGKKVA